MRSVANRSYVNIITETVCVVKKSDNIVKLQIPNQIAFLSFLK